MTAVRWIAIVVVLLALLLIALWLGQRRLIYYPASLPSTAIPPPGFESVVLETSDGLNLGAWFRPGPDGAATVILFPGNAGNRANRSAPAKGLAERGLGVLLIDYRGYGGNDGSPSEEGLAKDARAARRFLETNDQLDQERVVYLGESLGAAVALGLAVEHPPAALILRSPFTSLADAGSQQFPFLPLDLLLWDKYPSLDRAAEYTGPVLVIAGTGDEVIPIDQSRTLFDAFTGPKEFLTIEAASHNDPALSSGPMVIDATARFVERWGT